MAHAILKSPAQFLLETQIRADLQAAGFKKKNIRIEAMLVASILLIRDYLANPVIPAGSQTLSGQNVRGAKNKDEISRYFFSMLFTAWHMEFGVKPKINNKGGTVTPFTQFAAPIMKREKFGKFIDHAEKYQSYRTNMIETIEEGKKLEFPGGVDIS